MKYFDEEDAITEYEKQLQKKDNEIERLKEQLNDEIDDELKQSEIMVKKQEEIERLTFESTKWESKFYDEAKKVDRAIDYITTEQLYTNYQWGKSQYEKILKDLLDILKGSDKE